MVPVPCRSLERLQDFINAEMLRWGKVGPPMTLGTCVRVSPSGSGLCVLPR